MLRELPPARYEEVKPLFAPLAYLPFCAGALEGSHAGRVFVDDTEQPRAAFLVTFGCWCYLAGDPAAGSFVDELHEALMSRTLLGAEAWGLFLTAPEGTWTEQLPALCAPLPPVEMPRRHYVAHRIDYDWRAAVPEGYTIRRADPALVDVAGKLPEDIEGLIDKIDWSVTPPDRRCGFVALHGDAIVAHAMIDCVAGDVGEIGLYTAEAHRRRGLAMIVSAATLEHGLANGLSSVVWDCYEYNAGSVRLAEKLGLAREHDHMMYSVAFNVASHWAMLAWHTADQGDYAKARTICERIVAEQEKPSELTYVAAARAWAALGAPGKAFAALDQAIEAGWAYAPDLECSEFGSLRGTPEWQALVARLG